MLRPLIHRFNLPTWWVKKSAIWGAWCKIVPFLVEFSCMVFLILFENLYLFWYFNGPPKKSANLFSLKIKGSEKQKCVYKLFLSKSKIVWVLRFQLKTKQRIFNTLEYVRRKELENLNNFSLKIRLEPKIANFLITICKLSVGFPT